MVILKILDQYLQLSPEQLAFYKQYNFIKIKEVLPVEVVEHFNQIISKKVEEINTQDLPLTDRDTYGKAFLQLFNLWELDTFQLIIELI